MNQENKNLNLISKNNLSQKIIDKIDENELKDLYLNKLLSIENISKELNISYESVKKLISYYNLTRDKQAAKSNSLCKSELVHKKYNNIKERISKETLYQWYVIEDHYYQEAPKHFNITQWQFDKLCKEYNIKKDRSKSNSKHLENMYNIYGSKENYFEHISNLQRNTRIKNYGSIEESYKQGFEKVKSTMLKKYGYEYIFNNPDSEKFYKKSNSRPNLEFKSLLDKYNLIYSREFPLNGKSYDFKINNNLIEINPSITHNINWLPYGDHKGLDPSYHQIKSQLAKENNYRCIHIWDWDDKEKIIKSLLPKETIYARKCELKIINDNSIIDKFLNDNHFQNTCKGQKICLALYYNDNLVELMTFGKPRYNKNYQWELLRLCSDYRYNILGGSKKLFKYFIDNYKPQSIISYCDLSKFNGDVYIKLGFKLGNKATCNKHWYNIKSKLHITDNLLRQHGFDRLFSSNYGKGTCNEDLMRKNGFLEIYDCGQARYSYRSNYS